MAPIFNRQGEVVANVSVTAPSFRLTFERLEEIAPSELKAARNITLELGGRGCRPGS